eukprot:6140720-Lingulodinium_polyedra.AAC.1
MLEAGADAGDLRRVDTRPSTAAVAATAPCTATAGDMATGTTELGDTVVAAMPWAAWLRVPRPQAP